MAIVQWFPGSSAPDVQEVTELGLTYGITPHGRVWHGDMLTEGGIIAGPGHDAAEADYAQRLKEARGRD